MFEFNENEFKNYVLEKDYMTDPNYDENLNITSSYSAHNCNNLFNAS